LLSFFLSLQFYLLSAADLQSLVSQVGAEVHISRYGGGQQSKARILTFDGSKFECSDREVLCFRVVCCFLLTLFL
jgi:hypothetical protein